MAVGNNKLITATNWRHNQKRRGLIYTKDLTTNQWSYEVYPIPVGNITRGKDRFVGMTESSALVLVDGSNSWKSILLTQSKYSSLTYGLDGKFIGTNPIKQSVDGEQWVIGKNFGAANIACNKKICFSVGHDYHIIGSFNGIDWKFFDFEHKNPQPNWWRRFINS